RVVRSQCPRLCARQGGCRARRRAAGPTNPSTASASRGPPQQVNAWLPSPAESGRLQGPARCPYQARAGPRIHFCGFFVSGCWPQHSNKRTRSGVPYVADLQRVPRIKADSPFLILTKLSYSVDCVSVPDEGALGWVPVSCWFDCLMVVLQ